MALIKGKQLQDTSVSLGKLSGLGAVTVTGTITAPAASLIISSLPTSPSQAANKEYVDSVATGLDVKQSVKAIYRPSIDATTGTPGTEVVNVVDGQTVDEDTFYTIISTSQTFTQLVLDGVEIDDRDRVLIAATISSRQKINGIWVYDRGQGILVRAIDSDNQTQGGEVSGGLFTFVEEGDVFADTGWVLSFPNGEVTGLWDNTLNPGGDAQLQFTQFSAAGVAEAGVGLTRIGTKFNVNFDNSSIGINASDELFIKAAGVTNAMLVNSTTGFAGDTGTGTVALGSTLTIAGGTNGIDTAFSGSTLTINLDLSELATVTSITDSDFIAISSSAAANQKITFANLKSLIGAVTQLAIIVEGDTGNPSSFDLDIDTLDFATGPGLTFTKSDTNIDDPDTLTLTISNNPLNVHQATSFTTAANGNTDITLSVAASEIFSVTVNGVMLKKTTNWVWPQGGNAIVRVTGLPYALEASDDIEITYRVF